MRITRVVTKNILSLPDGTLDFPEKAIVTASNDAGKTCLHALLCVMLDFGAARQSLASLVRRDTEGVVALDSEGEQVIPEATVFLEGELPLGHDFYRADAGDGCADVRGCGRPEAEHEPPRYRLWRRAGDIKTEVEKDGAWVKMPGSALAALERIIAPGASPETLLAPRLTDAGRVKLLLDVVPQAPFEPAALLAQAGVQGSLAPIPAGGHQLEFLAAVERQLADARSGVARAKATASGVAEKLAAALPAQAPKDPCGALAGAEAELAQVREHVVVAERSIEGTYAEAVRAAQTAARDAIQSIERADSEWEAAQRAELQRRIDERRAAREVAVGGHEPARDQAIGRAEATRTTMLGALQDERARLQVLAANVAKLKEQVASATRDAALREQAQKAAAEAEAHAERHAALTAQIKAVRALAAKFIGDALPGVRIVTDESSGKPAVQVETKAGWQAWDDANEATRRAVADRWSALRQTSGDSAGSATTTTTALRIHDRAEGLDAAARARILAEPGQVILFVVGDGPLRVEEAK